MQKILSVFSVFVFSLVLAASSMSPKVFADENPTESKVIITEVKLGDGNDVNFADGTTAKDFVTLYNATDMPILLDGWSLQYAKASQSFTDCGSQFASPSITQLSGTLLPGSASMPIKRSMTDGADGTLKFIDSLGVVKDLVGWGDSTKCYEDSPAQTPPDGSGKSIQRYIGCDNNLPIDTDDNSVDFALSDIPSPGVLAGPVTDGCAPTDPGTGGVDNDNTPPPDDVPGGQGAGPQTSCDGLIINELLPNPSSADTGHEFIELYNPTEDIIPLSGCKLQTSANTKIYEFAEGQLQPGQYQAFYNDKTGLTLANSGGGTVYLIDTDDTEIYQVNYASDLYDDVSWSLIDGEWMDTFSVTPNKVNELLEIKPCPSGQIRNIDTNRCSNIVTEAAGLGSCPAGKERNPDTNRCRNISSLASILKSCAADQIRNPATGRCKKVSDSSLLPCSPGQERNPDTHRCRKVSVSSSSGINGVKDVLSATSQGDHTNWLAASLAAIGALLYVFWEWRNEIIQQLGVLKSKFV